MARAKDPNAGNSKPNPNAKQPPPISGFIQNKDLLLRLSFMHQAATYLHQSQATIFTSSIKGTDGSALLEERRPDGLPGKGKGKEKASGKGKHRGKARKEDGRAGSLDRLARCIGKGIKEISVHNKARLDPSFKRSICRTCSSILVPGTTSQLKVKPSSSHVNLLRQTCLYCSQSRCIPAPPNPPPSALLSTQTPSSAPETTSNESTRPTLTSSLDQSLPPSLPSGSISHPEQQPLSPIPAPPSTPKPKNPQMSKKKWRDSKRTRPALLSQREGAGHARWLGGPENGPVGKLEEFCG